MFVSQLPSISGDGVLSSDRKQKVEALSALKRLQELLAEGAESFAARVMLEISNPDIGGQGSTHDEGHASTPLLREIQEGAELIRVEVSPAFFAVECRGVKHV